MKWEAADLRVGAAVLTVIAIVIAAILWLSPVLAKSGVLYAEFTQIDGLAIQAPVYLNGYTVGRVDRIEPRSANRGALVFHVRMKLDWKLPNGDSLPLFVGTRARLTPPPMKLANAFIIGVIDLDSPLTGGAPLLPGSVIPGVRTAAMTDEWQSLATNVSGDLLLTLTAARSMMDSLVDAARSLNTAADRAGITFDKEFPAMMKAMDRGLATADTVMREARSLTPSALAGLDSARALLNDSRRLVGDVSQMLTKREPEIERMVANLDSTAVLLQHFVRQVTAKPTRVFTGVKPPAGMPPLPRPTVRDSLRQP